MSNNDIDRLRKEAEAQEKAGTILLIMCAISFAIGSALMAVTWIIYANA